MLTTSAAIIKHIMTLRDAGKATLGCFYFDYKDKEKQNVHNAVTSFLIQISACSWRCRDIIYRLYSEHGKGTQEPAIENVIDCLKEMITATAPQQPIFIFLDALDECPGDGLPTPRGEVMKLVQDLVSMHLQICTSVLQAAPKLTSKLSSSRWPFPRFRFMKKLDKRWSFPTTSAPWYPRMSA
jgi:hypothetical protein